jgi:hypothetical protein
MRTLLWIGALSVSALMSSRERDAYGEAAKHLPRAMHAEVDVLSAEFLVTCNSTESPRSDAPIFVINGSFRSQLKGFRAPVREDAPNYEESLSALLRASLAIEMLRWDVRDRKPFEAVKDSFTAAQGKRIEALFFEGGLAPESLRTWVADHLTDAKKAAAAILGRLSK